MVVNEEKAKYQIFTLAKNPIDIRISYNRKDLEKTDEAKYLGVIFDNRLTWNKQIEEVTKKATKRSILLKRLAGKKWGSSRSTLNTTYNLTYIHKT
jgi:hypothetical protein